MLRRYVREVGAEVERNEERELAPEGSANI
jgi:hypothetical protein